MKSGEFIVRFRWLIIALSIIITVVVGLNIFRAEIDPDLEKYIPPHMPSRLSTEKIESIFGGDDMLIAVFETDDVLNPQTLGRIKKIRREIKKLDETDQVLSVFDTKNMYSENGILYVEPFVEQIPESSEEIIRLRGDLLGSDMAMGVVVSGDFRLATIIISLNKDALDNETVAKVQQIIDENPGSEKVYLGGLPFLKSVVADDIAADFKKLMIIGLVLMLIMLYFFFREMRGVVLPFLVVIFAIVFSMGLVPLLGWKLSIITLLLPIMLIAVANDYGIHLMAHSQELTWKNESYSNGALAKKVFSSLLIPILLTGFTTVAGILSLLSHQMIPARQLGIVTAAAIVYAIILSLFFIPAVLSMLKKSNVKKHQQNGKKRLLDRLLFITGSNVTKRPSFILIASLVLVIGLGAGAFMLHVDTNLENFFPAKHPVRKSAVIINKQLGGSQNLSVHIEGDILDPSIMKRIDRYTEELKDQPGVGNVVSVSTVIREISKAMNNPVDLQYNRIPDTREGIAQYLELYNMSGDPGDLEKLVDFGYENAQIIVRINDGSNIAIKNVLSRIKEMTRDDPNVKRIGGYGLIVAELADLVVRGQVLSLLIAIFIIALIMAVAFRSISAGLMASTPLIFALVILFGLMGYFHINLDVATALLSSIMIGVGVDYTIHFLWRYRKERFNGILPKEAVIRTLTTTGRGITFNALSVIIGFIALPFSSFAPIRFFGFLVIFSIFTCLVGAMVIIPSLVLVFRPAFLEPHIVKDKSLGIRLKHIFGKAKAEA